MKATSIFFAVIFAMILSSCGISSKIELSTRAMKEYPSLEYNLEDVQFFISSDILLEKLKGEDDSVSANGTLTLVYEALLIPEMKEVEVIKMSSDKKTVEIAVDTAEDVTLSLSKKKRGKYILTDVGEGDYTIIKKGKGSKIFFNPEKLERNIREATGVKIGE